LFEIRQVSDSVLATLEAAKAEFEASWRQWLAWAKLGEEEQASP
jgi:hypothetical protein